VLIVVESLEVCSNRCPIAACDGPGECSHCPVLGHVGECHLHHSPESGWVDVEPTGERFDFGTECNKVIGGDRCGCVICRAIIVGNIEGDASEEVGYRTTGWVARDGESAAIEQACGADCRVGKGHQRVNRASSSVRGEHIEPAGTRAVRNDRWPGIDRPSDLRNDIVGRADQDEIDVGRSGGEVVTISDFDVEADRCQCTRERSACPPGPDDPDAGEKR
jgi:hypothetical protein